MKKIIAIFCLFFICGCEINNTPTKKVEELFTKYQTLHEDIMNDLDEVVSENNYTKEQQEEYKNIMKKHYKNLTYKIKDTKIDANKATVEVEITVTDYSKILNDANLYRDNYIYEFMDEENQYSEQLFIDYKLNKIKEAEEKVKYTLEIPLTKVNKTWNVDSLSPTTLDKIHGIYIY